MLRRGHNPSAREVGRALTEAFAADREELQRVVETQLRKLREMPDMSPSAPGVPMSYAPVDLSRMQLATGSLTPPPGQTGSGFTKSAFTGPAQHQTPAVTSTGVVQPKPFPVGIVLAGLGLLVLFSAGLLAFALFHKDPPVVAKPITSAPIVTATPADTSVPASDRIVLSLNAEPATVKFIVDGTPVDGNPYSGPYKRDGLTHQVRAEAAGYDTERFSVVFDGDVQKHVSLKKTHWVGAGPGPAPKPPPSATASATTESTGVHKPPREIDTSFPH
jgi:hypothetical protein